jgi:hypothetical protein
MKRILIPLLLLIGVAGYLSCQKVQDSTSSLTASKTSGIKKCEPVIFTVNNNNGQPIKWLAGVPVNVRVISADAGDSNNLKVVFLQPGNHTVQASWGGRSVSITVNVIDSCYRDSSAVSHYCSCYIDTIPGNPTDTIPGHPTDTIPGHPTDSIPGDTIINHPHDTTLSLVGDQIYIMPAIIDTAGYSGLILYSITQHNYVCYNHSLNTLVTGIGGSYTLTYTGVYVPANCQGGMAPAQSSRVLLPIQDGTHAFSVVLNNVTYTGSFTKTGGHYAFTWPYTSGVIISPLTLN